jgi:peptidoglycan-associated lipoprotein
MPSFGKCKFSSGLLVLLATLLIALLSGCPSKTPVAVAPPPTPPPPAVTLTVEPASVQTGQPVTIDWKTENAGEVTIYPLGAVAANGSQTITPGESTTYRLIAKGPGGVKEVTASVSVEAVTSIAEAPPLDEKDLEGAGSGRLDVYFEYNDFSISTAEQLKTIKNDADFLKQHPAISVRVEGHCDETGSIEYNIVLGERRATEVKSALEKAGVTGGRIAVFSFGKERPFCEEESEQCMRMNRRAHIVTQVE